MPKDQQDAYKPFDSTSTKHRGDTLINPYSVSDFREVNHALLIHSTACFYDALFLGTSFLDQTRPPA